MLTISLVLNLKEVAKELLHPNCIIKLNTFILFSFVLPREKITPSYPSPTLQKTKKTKKTRYLPPSPPLLENQSVGRSLEWTIVLPQREASALHSNRHYPPLCVKPSEQTGLPPNWKPWQNMPVALEYSLFRVGVLVLSPDEKPMKWCYVFTIPYDH